MVGLELGLGLIVNSQSLGYLVLLACRLVGRWRCGSRGFIFLDWFNNPSPEFLTLTLTCLPDIPQRHSPAAPAVRGRQAEKTTTATPFASAIFGAKSKARWWVLEPNLTCTPADLDPNSNLTQPMPPSTPSSYPNSILTRVPQLHRPLDTLTPQNFLGLL